MSVSDMWYCHQDVTADPSWEIHSTSPTAPTPIHSLPPVCSRWPAMIYDPTGCCPFAKETNDVLFFYRSQKRSSPR
jgi:hypothetical protein